MTQNEEPVACEVLQRLKDGNKRFVQGVISINTLATQLNRQVLASQGQNPHTIILTCSDSRVPAEMIFDCGLGELFVIRVAGNIIAPSLIGSIEFAAVNFNISLCLVMGHSGCGAITLAVSHAKDVTAPSSPHLKRIVDSISPAVRYIKDTEGQLDNRDAINLVSRRNVLNTVSQVQKQSPLISNLIDVSNFKICGAFYDINSGQVEFFD